MMCVLPDSANKWERENMLLRINERLKIDNLNDYPAEVVSHLEELLASGVEARLDPKRNHFYDVENSGRMFFIHAKPPSGNVILLATWPAGASLAEQVTAA
jgi:hypothetical protein